MGFIKQLIKNPVKAVYDEQKQFFGDPLGGLDAAGAGVNDSIAAGTGGETRKDLDMHNQAETAAVQEEKAAEDTRVAGEAQAIEDAFDLERRRSGRGRASTLLTGPRGLLEDQVSARRTLLGA